MLTVKYLSLATSTFIIKVSRDHYRIAWAALSFMSRVPVDNGKRCVFRVIRVSGTIRKAQEEAVRRCCVQSLSCLSCQKRRHHHPLVTLLPAKASPWINK